jgi:hypothetical protein
MANINRILLTTKGLVNYFLLKLKIIFNHYLATLSEIILKGKEFDNATNFYIFARVFLG